MTNKMIIYTDQNDKLHVLDPVKTYMRTSDKNIMLITSTNTLKASVDGTFVAHEQPLEVMVIPLN